MFKWNDGTYYDGLFKDDHFEGYGEYIWMDGKKY